MSSKTEPIKMNRPKHASYGTQRVPTMQLMSQVSSFMGQRKEEAAARVNNFNATTVSIFLCDFGNVMLI